MRCPVCIGARVRGSSVSDGVSPSCHIESTQFARPLSSVPLWQCQRCFASARST